MNNQKQFEYWLEYATNDLKTAEILFEHGKKRGFAYQACVFHCHQAVEKILKAVLVADGKLPAKVHDLISLAARLSIKLPTEITDKLHGLNPHYLLPRYPDLKFAPTFHFSYNQANVYKILSDTKTIFLWFQKQLKK